MTIYDADYAYELQAQENAEKAQNTAVMEPVAEVQEDPEVQQEVLQKDEVQEESRPQETESDADRNWKAVRDELARMREENAYLKGRIDQRPKEEEADEFSKLDDDEYLSKAQVKQYLDQIQKQNQQKLAEMKLDSDQEFMRLQFNDYDEVVNNHFIPLLEQNPYFKVQLQQAPNAAAYAYKIGKGAMMEKQMSVPKEQPVERAKSNDAERIVQNSRKPATLSSSRGGAPKISQADYYATMSDADFAKLLQKNLEEV